MQMLDNLIAINNVEFVVWVCPSAIEVELYDLDSSGSCLCYEVRGAFDSMKIRWCVFKVLKQPAAVAASDIQ